MIDSHPGGARDHGEGEEGETWGTFTGIKPLFPLSKQDLTPPGKLRSFHFYRCVSADVIAPR